VPARIISEWDIWTLEEKRFRQELLREYGARLQAATGVERRRLLKENDRQVRNHMQEYIGGRKKGRRLLTWLYLWQPPWIN